MGQTSETLGVVQAQGPHIGDHRPGNTGGGGFTGGDSDQIGAELTELGQHETVDPFPDGGEQNHRRHPHPNAENGEKTAEALVYDRAESQPGCILKVHALPPHPYRRESDATGSNRAARRAGRVPKSKLVPSAMPTPATRAQMGTKAGKSG